MRPTETVALVLLLCACASGVDEAEITSFWGRLEKVALVTNGATADAHVWRGSCQREAGFTTTKQYGQHDCDRLPSVPYVLLRQGGRGVVFRSDQLRKDSLRAEQCQVRPR